MNRGIRSMLATSKSMSTNGSWRFTKTAISSTTANNASVLMGGAGLLTREIALALSSCTAQHMGASDTRADVEGVVISDRSMAVTVLILLLFSLPGSIRTYIECCRPYTYSRTGSSWTCLAGDGCRAPSHFVSRPYRASIHNACALRLPQQQISEPPR